MSDRTLFEAEADVWLEPERYELDLVSAPLASLGMDRRDFLRLVGGGLVVLCLSRSAEAQQQESGGGRRRKVGGRWEDDPAHPGRISRDDMQGWRCRVAFLHGSGCGIGPYPASYPLSVEPLPPAPV